ncbi:SseB family protein [Iamia sp. SCSIO 61187]|uniref:SseB family protein n=1 Tax=Iamia sp. SCSIO 61187 TaxID=2722752 RepID=UPI001C628E96|nr:SseB family protein [Iamia sp. SCSIO 61187]QYG93904.1 SseB family protein [Iamia sp. SCSIO 61187]
MSTDVAPLPLPPLDPVVDRIRRVVVERDDLDLAFLYLRDLHPAVGLVGPPDALAPGSDAVGAVAAAAGVVYGEAVTIVGLRPDVDVLDALLAIAPPIGAGGRLEVDLVALAAARGDGDRPGEIARRAGVRATAAVVDADLVVPVDPDRPGGGPARTGAVALHLPIEWDGQDRAILGAFTSRYAMVHALGPAAHRVVRGWALVEAIGDDVHLVLDPGLPWSWTPPPDLLRGLARRSPAGR